MIVTCYSMGRVHKVKQRGYANSLPRMLKERRHIVAITGANSGIGLSLGELLLSQLSLPESEPVPASRPQPFAVPAYIKDQLNVESVTQYIPGSPPVTLTLILACRSGRKAAEAKQHLEQKHEAELLAREQSGQTVKKGWREGLEIVWEPLDMDAVGGENGVLGFSERLKKNYPYITSLFLNAGMGAFIGVDWGKALLQMACGPVEAVTHPNYKIQKVGVKTSDGERGLIWSINVFANYVLAKELVGHLQKSPDSLICPPRIIYTSSSISDGSYLPEDPLSDYQLLTVPHSYEASKYIADLVFSDLDQSFGATSKRPIRCLLADPGIAATNVFSAGLNFVSSFFMMLAFYFARIYGQSEHNVRPENAALGLLYLSLVPAKYLYDPPSPSVPPVKYRSLSSRWGVPYVGVKQNDGVEDTEELRRGVVERCEALRQQWRLREGLDRPST